MNTWLSRIAMICLTAAVAVAGAADAMSPQSASPGAEDRILVLESRCPTFTWEPVEGALFNQLVVYRLPADGSEPLPAALETEDEALYTEVPGGAGAWTPSADHCLESGGRFVWFVRAVHETAGDDVVASSEWSPGRYFAVPAAPTEGELRQALETLRRWQATGGAAPNAAPDSVPGPSGSPMAPPQNLSAKSVPTAAAAIRGAHPDRSGEVYGVVGTSASPDGAGVAAANLDGGPDLVLDGSEDSAPDLHLSQAGAWTSSRNDTVFHLANADVGAMSLEVEGAVTATALTCPLCVDAADLASSAVTNAKIASSAVTSAKIADGTIQPADVAFNYAGSTSQGGAASNLACTACVAAAEISTSGGSTGQVLTHYGTSVSWADGGLTLPFQGGAITSTEEPVFSVSSWTGFGWAIHGEAANNNAIVGEASSNGSGVFGRNLATTGVHVGVTGLTASSDGIGVSGLGDVGAPDATGVKGTSTGGTGVLGVTGRTYGVRGETEFGHGVSGVTHGPDTLNVLDGAGVYGETTGTGFGVMGITTDFSGAGVRGESGSNWGDLGRPDAGVKGFGAGTDPGADFESASGYGVHALSGGSGLTGAALWAENDNAGGIAVKATNDSTDATIVGTNSGTGDLLKLFSASGNLRLRVTNAGEVSADGAFTPGGADFAELLPARDEALEPGDVLAISADGRLMRSVEAYQASVVGVYSTKPGLLGGSPENGDRRGLVPLAVVGVVPVKACDQNGPVRPGDMLVASSVPGHAMRAGDRAPNGRVIGKALSGLERGVGAVTMLVILQ